MGRVNEKQGELIMKDKDADALVKKCIRVILSCKNNGQLDNAVNYCNLAIRKLSRNELKLDKRIDIMEKLHTSKGYAMCQIQNNKVN